MLTFTTGFEPWFPASVGLIIGLVLGSFINMAAWRIPRKMGWFGRSFCDECQKPLKVTDLIPVVSWLIYGGKSSCCKIKLSPTYPIIELASGICCAVAGYLAGISDTAALLCVLSTLLIILIVVDLEHHLMPNTLNAAFFGSGVIWVALGNGDYLMNPVASLMLFLVGLLMYFVYSRLRGKRVIGGGDVKFFAGAGLWIGFDLVPHFLLASSLIGIVFGITWRKLNPHHPRFPFAPALCASVYGCVIYQLL